MTLEEVIESVRRVEVRTHRLVNDTMVGAYLSHFKGRGMDFEELREYLPGDDVRDIDWNVTYRMNRPFVKRYREERELGMILALDVSASTAFGSGRRTKREFAVEVAATLAFAAAHGSDKVGLLLFTGQVELYVPPKKGRRQILRLIREMLAFEPRHGGTDVAGALAFLNRVAKRRSIVFLITDFLYDPARPKSASGRDVVQEMGFANARHDLICVHINDPRELELPDAGIIALEDAETGELLLADSTRLTTRQRYAAANAERIRELDQALCQTGVDTLRLNAGEPFVARLRTFFDNRRRRR
jgi:uncharacterized protein (DUF58 family)